MPNDNSHSVQPRLVLRLLDGVALLWTHAVCNMRMVGWNGCFLFSGMLRRRLKSGMAVHLPSGTGKAVRYDGVGPTTRSSLVKGILVSFSFAGAALHTRQ
jgi:hypothetical protein